MNISNLTPRYADRLKTKVSSVAALLCICFLLQLASMLSPALVPGAAMSLAAAVCLLLHIGPSYVLFLSREEIPVAKANLLPSFLVFVVLALMGAILGWSAGILLPLPFASPILATFCSSLVVLLAEPFLFEALSRARFSQY